MNSQRVNGRGLLLVVVSIVALLWGILGIFENRDDGSGRFFFGPDRVVVRVVEGGPGEAAGIQVGDRVVSVDGTPAEELPMQSRWSPTRVGESRSFVLDRDGQTITAEVMYAPPNRDPVPAGIRGLLVSLSFVVFGLWALFSVRTSLAWVGALIGVTFAAGSATGPHLGALQGVSEHIRIACVLLCLIFMLRFFVTFPKPKKISGSPSARRAIQGVFLLFVAFLVAELVVHPVLYTAYPIVFVILILALLIHCIVAVIHSAVKCTVHERRETGLNLVLWGMVIGVLIPIIAPLFAGTLSLSPDFMRDWMWVLEIGFPASLALAVTRRAHPGDVALD